MNIPAHSQIRTGIAMSLHSRVDIIAAICKTDVSVKTTKAKHPNFSEPLQDNRPVVNMKNTASTADPTWNALATRRNGYFFLIFIASNVDVLPPGKVGVIEGVTVELLPVGSDDLLAFLILWVDIGCTGYFSVIPMSLSLWSWSGIGCSPAWPGLLESIYYQSSVMGKVEFRSGTPSLE